MGRVIIFKCIPTRKSFGNNENEYKMYTCKSKDKNVKYNSYDSITIKGNIYELPIGVEHKVTAEEDFSSQYKYSYKIKSIEREIPNDARSTRMFLNEILTSNQVDVLMDVYPDIVDRVMEDRLEDVDLSKTKGIKEYTFNVIKEKIIENFAISRAIIEFGNLIDFKTLKKLYEKYKSTRMIKIKLSKEPYIALCELARVGFKTADTIMLELEKKCNQMILDGKEPPLKFEEDLKSSKMRMRSALQFVLSENELKEQNTRMPLSDLKKGSNLLVKDCMHHFTSCIKESLDVLHIDSDGCISRKEIYNKAVYVAGKIIKATEESNVWNIDSEKYRKDGDITLTDDQFSLLDEVLKHKICALQGFAGVGKSASTKMVVNMLKENGKSVTLMSPTGRASKVQSQYCKMPASTIHRGLAFNGHWGLDHFNNILSDIVIIDETSMADLDLMYRLISAINFSHTKLLLIGDFEQLPSVGAGNVFYDLVTSKVIPVVYLDKVFRYGIGGISTVVTNIRQGKIYVPTDLRKPMTLGEDKGFMFLPSSKSNTVKTAINLYKALLNKGYKPEDILVLSSQNVGAYGTRVLNNELQKVANGDNMKYDFIESTEQEDKTKYYRDDLIIQTSNNYKGEPFKGFNYSFDSTFDRHVFIPNGDIGVVSDINEYNNKCSLRFDESVLYQKSMLNLCMLAYSISIHKSQGGQAKVVILVTPRSHMHMLNSNILYVGASRAQEKLFQIGEPSSIPEILRKKENLNRDTNLPQLLKKANKTRTLKLYDNILEQMKCDNDKYEEYRKEKEVNEKVKKANVNLDIFSDIKKLDNPKKDRKPKFIFDDFDDSKDDFGDIPF